MKIKLPTEFNYDDLAVRQNGKPVDLQFPFQSSVLSKYDINNITGYNGPTYNFKNDIMKLKSYDDYFEDSLREYKNKLGGNKGGLKKNVQKKIMIKDKIQEVVPKETNIRAIGEMVITKIVEKFPDIKILNLNNQQMTLIKETLLEQNYNIDQETFLLLLRYVKENFQKRYQKQIITNHPLLKVIYEYKDDNVVQSYIDMILGNNFCESETYEKITKDVRCLSEDWNGLEDLDMIEKRVNMFGSNKDECPIDPLIYLLYSLKIPGFEDLSVIQDYPKMLRDTLANKITKDNFFLMALKMYDPSMLPSKDPAYMNSIMANEQLRIHISILLKRLSQDVRWGYFKSEFSTSLNKLLSNIHMPNSRFKEENMLQAILAVFSFKPTLITEKNRSLFENTFMNEQNKNNQDILFTLGSAMNSVSRPIIKTGVVKVKSVYTLDFPLIDSYGLSIDTTPQVLVSENFQNLVYSPQSNSAIFVRNSITTDQPVNKETLLGNIMINLLSQKPTSVFSGAVNDVYPIISINPSVTSSFDQQFNLEPSKILLTNGVFFLTINRKEKTLKNCHYQNSFYNSNLIKKTINLTPIVFDPDEEIDVSGIKYSIRGALCYDVDECCDNISMNYVVDADNLKGTYSIMRSENGKWYKYNPNRPRSMKQLQEKVNKILERYYNNRTGEDDLSYDDWLAKPENNSMEKDLLQQKINIKDMEISADDAKSEIYTNACIIIYSENYADYKYRCQESIVSF